MFFFVPEKFVECVGNNLRTAAFCHSQKSQVTIAEAKAEADFYPQGTSKIKIHLTHVTVSNLLIFLINYLHSALDYHLPSLYLC